MMELVRPCADCPFRSDKPFHLGRKRRQEIADSLAKGEPFLCHKTVHYGEKHWPSDGTYRYQGDEQHCAGAMILLQKEGRPNQPMQVLRRLELWHPRKLAMDSPVFGTLEDFVEKGA